MPKIRKVLITFLGHVDHGKSSLLDFIRGTIIIEREAGMITQAIGASIIPIETVRRVCGDLLKTMKTGITIPGFLAIDTPGHAAFTNLRRRGGNLADIAILVVDINEGIKPQTLEAIEILKQYKTPFIIAANKIDLITGWKKTDQLLLKAISMQDENTQKKLDEKLYELVGKLHELGFSTERFDRLESYTKQVAIVPTSAKTGDGIPELLMMLTGLAQRFLEKCLTCDIKGPARGTVLEVKESKGIGCCLDIIIYDGTLKVNDTLVIGGLEKPIVTKVRALFEPAPLAEMRDIKSKFQSVKEVFAAVGVRVSAPELQDVVAGMPVRSTTEKDLEKTKEEIQKEVEEVIIETDKEGIVIKADSLGSLEAMIKLLREKNIPIRKASIGNVTKKDITDAESNYEKDPLKSVILCFNVSSELSSEKVKIISSDIIYKILEDLEKWQIEEKKRQEAKQLDVLVRPCKLEIMKGYIFRQSNPAIVGVDILTGILKTGIQLMKTGKPIATVKSIQQEKENLTQAEQGKQVAIALEGVMVGRQINEGDTLYSAIPEADFRKLKKLKQYLSKAEIEVLKEIAQMKRKENPVWGV